MQPFLKYLAIAALLAPVLITGAPKPAVANDAAAAAIAAGIAGVAVGAAISSSQRHNRVIYEPGYYPAPPPPGAPFSPAPHVVCYPSQRACYGATGGGFSPRWTYQIFGN